MNLTNLTIDAAKRFLESSSEIEVRIDQLGDYVEAFNKLLASLETNKELYSREEVEPIAAIHQQIMEQAVELLGNTSEELRQLQAKGKAILAYTDTMPKRVSIRGKKRG